VIGQVVVLANHRREDVVMSWLYGISALAAGVIIRSPHNTIPPFKHSAISSHCIFVYSESPG